MNGKSKRRWPAEEKWAILEEGRRPGTLVSEVCRRHHLAPAQYYLWERQAKAAALQALRPAPRGRKPRSQEDQLREELVQVRVALGELALENLRLKKGL